MVFNKTAAGLGGRCRFMASGSAPMGKDVLDFMKVAICCPFY
jgi:long-chain acyl-CoA synthetase